MRKTIFAVVAVAAMVMVAGAAFADRPHAVDFLAASPAMLLELKGASYVPGSNQTMITFAFTKENGYLEGDRIEITFAGKYDSPEGKDIPLPAWVTAFTTITVKDFGATPVPDDEEDVLTIGESDLEKYFVVSSTGVADSVWKLLTPRQAYEGQTLTLAADLTGVMIAVDGKPTEQRTIKVPVSSAVKITATGAGDFLCAKKNDVETCDVSTYLMAAQASPTTQLKPQQVGESYSVEFYVGNDTWTPKTDGGDLIKIDVDQMRVTKSDDGKIYTATDGKHIGTVTLWFTNVDVDKPEPNPYAPENDPDYQDDGGSGGGGCDAGFGAGALTLFALAVVMMKRKIR